MRNSDIVMVGNPDNGKPEYTTFENLSKNLAKLGGSTKNIQQIDELKVNHDAFANSSFDYAGKVIYDNNVQGHLTDYTSADQGKKVKKDGTYVEAWQEYIPLPIRVNYLQSVKLTGYFSQPWAIIGLDENYQYVKTFAFHDTEPSLEQTITIDSQNVKYIITSCLINGLSNFKATSVNLSERIPISTIGEIFTITAGKYIDENGFINTQANLSYATFIPQQGATYDIYLIQPNGFVVGYGENGMWIEKYGRQSNADSSTYRKITITPSDSVKSINISFFRDYYWLTKIVKKSGGVTSGQLFQKFNSLQSLVESTYKGYAVVGSQTFNKVSTERYIQDFIRKSQKTCIVPLSSTAQKQSLPTVISDSFMFPFANGYGAGTTTEGVLEGVLKDGTLIGYHYSVPQVSIDGGNTWIVLKNAGNTTLNVTGRIDNIFICDNSDLIIEHVIDAEANPGLNHYVKRLKFVGGTEVAKWWVDDGNKLTIKGNNASAVANDVYLSKYWGFDSYKNIVLLSEYGKHGTGGATHVYLSTNYGETFSTILDLGNSVQISQINAYLNSPMVQRSYGITTGIHIHGVSYDHYADRIYVCIGDGGTSGSHILWSDNLGTSWKGNLYQQTFSMPPAHNEPCIMQALKVIPFENHLVVLSDAFAQGFFYLERTENDKIPALSWLHDISKTNESKFWDEGFGISFKPYMIGNISRMSKNNPMFLSTLLHSNADLQSGVKMCVVATWDGLSFWRIWEIDTATADANTNAYCTVVSDNEHIFIRSKGRVGKNDYVKLTQIH
ncbi:MAG: hypothetical protein ACK5KP_05440 [Paludibacteraceae bacterium]